jgi:Rps23 Pro-64 3,4-dihydroxylase Tpa1-like proline 4-hydroxylase
VIRPVDAEELRRRIRSATPFPHFMIDNFLDGDFARQVHDSFPAYDDARKMGQAFSTVNEKKKVQVTDATQFAPPVRELNRILAEPVWLEKLSLAFEIPNLLADEELIGGGIHQTGPGGRLDVHVDFNYIAERKLHRRLNILIFLNPGWKPEWGGHLELWDDKVKCRHHCFEPLFNRCVVFETNEISFHGVTAVNCPADRVRKSFAGYYYTKEPPPHWTGNPHGTIFQSRPDEVIRGRVLMPAERAVRSMRQAMWGVRRGIKSFVKRPPAGG